MLRRWMHRLLFPPLALVSPADAAFGLLLAHVLRSGDTGPAAYAAYLLSTWALVVTIVAGVNWK